MEDTTSLYKIKEIPGYPGYWADTYGDIWTAKKKGRIGEGWITTDKPIRKLRPGTNGGYYNANLSAHGIDKKKLIHFLVLLTFVGDRPEGMECCHGNGNCLDNRLSNLRWDTHTANIKDRMLHGNTCSGELVGLAKLNKLQVRIIRKYRKYPRYQDDLGRFFNVDRSQISRIVNNKTWKQDDETERRYLAEVEAGIHFEFQNKSKQEWKVCIMNAVFEEKKCIGFEFIHEGKDCFVLADQSALPGIRIGKIIAGYNKRLIYKLITKE